MKLQPYFRNYRNQAANKDSEIVVSGKGRPALVF